MSSSSVVVPNALCIPRIECNIPKTQILATFCKLKIGTIESVVEIPLKEMPRYKRIVIRLKWNDSERAQYMLDRFRDEKNVKIVYNYPMPWFWICVPNRLHYKLDEAGAYGGKSVRNNAPLPPPPPPPPGFVDDAADATPPPLEIASGLDPETLAMLLDRPLPHG